MFYTHCIDEQKVSRGLQRLDSLVHCLDRRLEDIDLVYFVCLDLADGISETSLFQFIGDLFALRFGELFRIV